MDKERLDEIENNIVNSQDVDKSVVQQVLLECIEEIRKLNNNFQDLKLGQHIIITGKTNSHEFEIGQECIVVEWDEFDGEEDGEYGVEAVPIEGGEHWFVRHTDYRVKV
ncbi:UNVERIFIED_CONTAM: hypothetical protein ABIC26_002641 [Paenibacillus sp. PvR008]